MRTHTSQFKNKIKEFGRELDSLISYEINNVEMELGNEQLNSVSIHYEGAVLKSVMKQLDIDSNIEIPIGTVLNYKIGMKVRNNDVVDYRDNYDYVDYGNYIVFSSEKQEDTNSYKLICYDKMLNAMKEYENSNITFPITVREYIDAICNKINVTFANSTDTFANYNKSIATEYYLDAEGRTMKYTFRDVLDQLAEVTASTICINENDELEIRYINNVTNSLPSEYVEVEYLESTGVEYIDTGYVPNNTSGFKIKMSVATDTDATTIGCRQSSSTNSRWFLGTNYNATAGRNTIYAGWNTNDGSTARATWIANKPFVYQLNYLNNRKRICDDVEYTAITTTLATITYSAYLFCYNLAGTPSLFKASKIYSCQISEGNDIVRDFVPCYRKSDNVAGLYDLVNDVFYTNQGTGKFKVGDIVDGVIDEETLKDVNVNFGEKFGPVNTVILSRSADADKVSLSNPVDLSDEDKIAIQISDNQIMNGLNRNEFLPDLLNKLYGLEYYINDFASYGICYLDVCDKYDIIIGDNTYHCIMFNDEVNVTQGLEENIHTNMQEENETEYKYTSSEDLGITQANIIAKKNEGSIEAITQTINGEEGINQRLNQVITNQTATDLRIDVMSTNIDDDGNVNAVTTKTKGFTFNDAGLKIESSETNFKALIDEEGMQLSDGNSTIAEYTKDGSKQANIELFGMYKYGKKTIDDIPMFVAQLYTRNNEEGFGHFYNRS